MIIFLDILTFYSCELWSCPPLIFSFCPMFLWTVILPSIGKNVTTVAEFIDPDWEDKVKSGLGLSYRPARLHGLSGRYDNPMLELTLSPSHGWIYEFGYWCY
jgi:hypothetical protein